MRTNFRNIRSSLTIMSNKRFFATVSFLFLWALPALALQDKLFSPSDVPEPVFDPTGFIIDPESRIIEEWKNEMIRSRETYFFSRYVEPVCVRVDQIRNPSDIEKFADKLVKLWDLENKTNGRFVFQLVCASEKKIVYRIGSRLTGYYTPDFLNELKTDIEEVHFSDANGTGDFVSLQRLGDHIYEDIQYDAAISDYSGNDGRHTYYPDLVARSPRGLTAMKTSLYQGATDLAQQEDASATNNGQQPDTPKNYFKRLPADEVEKNFSGINTTSVYASVNDVPNVRPINNSRVTNPDKILTPFAVDTINALLIRLEDSLGYQVAVICLNSIGDNDPHTFGTDLFNLWGIGDKETDNGLLMLLVHDQHAIEFITGRGTEGILTDVDCYNVQQEEMVPYFKNDDYVAGMIRGTQAVCDFFYGSPPLYSSGTGDDSNDDSTAEVATGEGPGFFESAFFRYYLITAAVLGIGWVLMLFASFAQRDLYKRYFMMKFFSLMIWIFIFPVPFLLLYFVTKSLMEKWRNTERFSDKTGEVMHKLGDHEEDKHLQKGQISEEKVKSIDYDVWITIGGTDVLILSYAKWFTKFNKCISCKFKTYFKVYDKTISAATYDYAGTGERHYRCENCGHQKTERYTIPRRTRSSSGSGGSSSGFSGGGSSWGGGSSRGGGSGSRW
jgi:uncharacterized protein